MPGLLVDPLDDDAVRRLPHRAAIPGLDPDAFARPILEQAAAGHRPHVDVPTAMRNCQPPRMAASTQIMRATEETE